MGFLLMIFLRKKKKTEKEELCGGGTHMPVVLAPGRWRHEDQKF